VTEELRPARSKAELTRVRQGWVMIALGMLTPLLVLLTHYNII
jgi:hypothetical protein